MARSTAPRFGAGIRRPLAAAASIAMFATVLASPAGAQTDQSGGAILCRGEVATIVGTNGPDRLVGTEGFDVIVGLGGNDTILGLGGNDLICGGDGNDSIRGGQGADIMFGEDGNDNIRGNQGDDRIFGADGNDSIRGQNGADFIDGGLGDDFILGGKGKDRIDGRSGDDEIGGGNNDDEIFGGLGDDILRGGNAADTISSGHGDDSVRGGLGVDIIQTGFFLGDTVDSGDRDDIINGERESTIPPLPAERASTPANRADTLAVVERDWFFGSWSREQTVKQLVARGHNEGDVNLAIDQLNINFDFHAQLEAEFQLGRGNFSRQALIDQVHLGSQFTLRQATEGVDALNADFVAEAAAAATVQLNGQPRSRALLTEILTSDFFGQFTAAEVAAAIAQLNVDFDAQAVAYAESINAQTFSCQGLTNAVTGFFGQFTAAEAQHAGEQLGVC